MGEEGLPRGGSPSHADELLRLSGTDLTKGAAGMDFDASPVQRIKPDERAGKLDTARSRKTHEMFQICDPG